MSLYKQTVYLACVEKIKGYLNLAWLFEFDLYEDCLVMNPQQRTRCNRSRRSPCENGKSHRLHHCPDARGGRR